MLTYLALAAATCLAFIITAARVIPLRRMLGFGTTLDVGFTLLIAALFYGTYTGLIVAVLSGLFMAAFVSLGRALIGYEAPAAVYWLNMRPNFIWTTHPPTASRPIRHTAQKIATHAQRIAHRIAQKVKP